MGRSQRRTGDLSWLHVDFENTRQRRAAGRSRLRLYQVTVCISSLYVYYSPVLRMNERWSYVLPLILFNLHEPNLQDVPMQTREIVADICRIV